MGCGSQETADAEQGTKESNSQSWMGGTAGEKPEGQLRSRTSSIQGRMSRCSLYWESRESACLQGLLGGAGRQVCEDRTTTAIYTAPASCAA